MIAIVRTDENDEDFLTLVALLDAELRERDGAEHSFYAQFNKPVGLAGVVTVYLDGEVVGCGAFKHYDEATAEIKRMFVRPNARGNRVAARVLAELEVWAGETGHSRSILETGKKQPEAIALYTRSGYESIPNYGQYEGVSNSICMSKRL